jgi:phosphoglycolate phosphatase
VAAVLFDLDMTLVETRADIAASANALREAWGLTAVDERTVASFIGDGIPKLLERVLGDAVIRGREDEALEWFTRHHDVHCLDRTYAYDGVLDLLQSLATDEIPVAVVSNKAERYCRRILEALGLAPHVAAVVGGDTTEERKPHPAPLQHALRALGSGGPSVMVGDTWRDVRAGHAISIRTIAVTWGLDEASALAAERPHALVTEVVALRTEILRQLRERQSGSQAPTEW